MNDLKEGELPLVTPITSESLPKLPRLFNRHKSRGPIVRFRVLAFAMPMAAQDKWAEDNQVGVGKQPHVMSWRVVFSKLPPDCRRAARVPIDGARGTEAPCYLSVVVATNRTVEDLKRAEDLDMIRNVQRILGTNEAPMWYIPQSA